MMPTHPISTTITRCQTPLQNPVRSNIAGVLASAFAKDVAMKKMLGPTQWQRISKRFFKAQLCFSDVILRASIDDQIVGVLAARTPMCSLTLEQTLFAPLLTRYLLGRQHKVGASLGREISTHLPAQPHCYINHLGVLPDHEGQGIARELLTQLHRSIPNLPVFVDCEPKIQRVYEKSGYQIIAHCGGDQLVLMRYSNE